MLIRLCGLSLALTLAACAAFQAQHGRQAPSPSGHEHHATAPSREFTELPRDAQVARIRGEAEAVKADLAREGRYLCCIEPACTECLLKFGECRCRHELRKEGPCGNCCGECRDGWVEGRKVDERSDESSAHHH